MAVDCDKIKTLLDDAQAAYHSLLTGRSARVLVDQNGERVEYTAANRRDLLIYVNRLSEQYAVCSGTNTDSGVGPLRFIFP